MPWRLLAIGKRCYESREGTGRNGCQGLVTLFHPLHVEMPNPAQLGGVRDRSGLDAVCSRLDPGCIRAINRAKHTLKKPDHPSGKIAWRESVRFRGVRVSCQTKSQLPRVGFPFVSANRNMTRCLWTSVVLFVLVMHLLCTASFLAAPFIKL